jgi:hypothetical protein
MRRQREGEAARKVGGRPRARQERTKGGTREKKDYILNNLSKIREEVIHCWCPKTI